MTHRREFWAFAATLAALVVCFLGDCLVGGKVLSPADILYATRGFEEFRGPDYEPLNRLQIDPVLQFQPWLEWNRSMLRRGRLPLWNDLAGCGTPHLANGQSAVFDPFNLIAYLGTLPDALAWIAAARLWTAGIGMFLLARRWGLGPYGRWFAGLAYPFCGFLVVWLLFPVTSVAIWMPWLLLATDKALDEPGRRTIALLAIVTGCTLLGGHVQTSAHLLIASLAYAIWKSYKTTQWRHPLACYAGGIVLGITLAAVEIVPLGFYLTRSPVWSDRAADRASVLTIRRPRALDAICTAIPYVFGSQRRGHPNLARAVGVHNLNESAGGYAGLATLVWLAPAAWRVRRLRPATGFLMGLVAIAFCGAFDVPPVANVLRAIPVLDVMDHRRLTLWVAFGLIGLGAIGLDELPVPGRSRWAWIGAAVLLVIAAGMVVQFAPTVRQKAIEHYAKTAAATPGADPVIYRQRAERQALDTMRFVPRYARITAGHLLVLFALAEGLRREWFRVGPVRVLICGIVLVDLIGFGYGLNPAIAREDNRPVSALITYLKQNAAPPHRILALGAELPPNSLMRYGLADVRNYDSIESARCLAYFRELFEPGTSRTSRREVTWTGVARTLSRLRTAGVAAIVAPTPPLEGVCDRVERVGSVWVGRLDTPASLSWTWDHGRIELELPDGHTNRIDIPISFDPGWQAVADDRPAQVAPDASGAFLSVTIPPRTRHVVLRYNPVEVRLSGGISLLSLAMIAWLGLSARGAIAWRKTPIGAWMLRRHRVRIVLVTSNRSQAPASH